MSEAAPAAPATQESESAPASAAPVGGIGTPAVKPEAPKVPLKIKNVEFKSEDEAYAEIERGRQANKLMAEANKRLAESSRSKKEFDDLVHEIKTSKNPRRLLERLGLTKEQAVEVFGRYIYDEEIVAREMSPEQRRIRELESEIKKTQEAREAEERKKTEEAREAAAQQEEVRLREEFTKAIKEKRLPPTRLAIRRVANYMAAYASQGVDVPVDRAIDLVMEDMRNEYSELFDELEPDQLIEKLGKERFMKLAKKISGWALKKSQVQHNEPVPSRKPVEKPKEEKMTPQEFQAYLRGLR